MNLAQLKKILEFCQKLTPILVAIVLGLVGYGRFSESKRLNDLKIQEVLLKFEPHILQNERDLVAINTAQADIVKRVILLEQSRTSTDVQLASINIKLAEITTQLIYLNKNLDKTNK